LRIDSSTGRSLRLHIKRFLKRCSFDTSVIKALCDDTRLVLGSLLAQRCGLILAEQLRVARTREALASLVALVEEACCLFSRDVLEVNLGRAERPDPIATTAGERPENTPTCDASADSTSESASSERRIVERLCDSSAAGQPDKGSTSDSCLRSTFDTTFLNLFTSEASTTSCEFPAADDSPREASCHFDAGDASTADHLFGDRLC